MSDVPIPAIEFYDDNNDADSLWNFFKRLFYDWQYKPDVKSDTNVIIFQPKIEHLRTI